MLAPKVNKKKNAINFLVLVLILIIIFIVIYQNFIAKKTKTGTDSGVSSAGMANLQIKPVEKIKKESFVLDVLDDERFLNLVEFKYKIKTLDELGIGKEDPFKTDDLLDTANSGNDNDL